MMDCDFTTCTCPDCGAHEAPGTRRNCPKRKPPPSGPGTEFAKLTTELRISKKRGCNCCDLLKSMDALGVSGCRGHRAEILQQLAANYEHYNLIDKIVAAASAVASGLAIRLSARDPLGSLLDEAIRRAEQSSSPHSPQPSA